MDYESYKTEISDTCFSLFKEGIEKYNSFIKNGEYGRQLAIIPTREEYTVTSKYLHRGYYCPSPVLDVLVDNVRRGKLHSGPTKRKKISNRYLFNSKDELYLVESYFPDSSELSREFIWREDNKRYGLLFYDSGEFFAISIETFENEKLQSYMILYCNINFQYMELSQTKNSKNDSKYIPFDAFHIQFAYYETYIYCDNVIAQWDFSEVMYKEGCEPSQLVFHNRYLPIYENEKVVSFEHIRVK